MKTGQAVLMAGSTPSTIYDCGLPLNPAHLCQHQQ